MVWRVGVIPRVLILLLALTVAGSAVSPAPAPAAPAPAVASAAPVGPEAQLTQVRFGSPQSISDAGVFIGRARGYFREVGLDVEALPFQSGPDLIPPMASGELQTGGGNFNLAVMNAIDRGVGLKVVADKGNARPGYEHVQVLLRRDLHDGGVVRTPADLRGRRIAVASLRSGAEAIAAQVLAQGGVGIDEVDLTVLGYSDMLLAFGNRAIDAGVVIEPTSSAGISRGLISMWPGGSTAAAFGGAYQAAVLYYSGQFAAQTEQARRFMVAYLRGVRDYNDAFMRGQGRDEVVRILAEATPIRDPAVYDQMQIAGIDPDGRLYRPSLQIELDYFRGRGYYTGPGTIDGLIDSSFAEYAAQQLGPYR